MKQGTMNILFFVLKTKLLKNGEAPILMRITINGQYEEARIQRSVPLKYWNAAKGCSKGKDRASLELNNFISELSVRAFEIHKNLILEQSFITPKLILQRVFGKDESLRTVLKTMKEEISNMEKVVNIDGSSDISRDSLLKKKTAAQIVYLNKHKQTYNYEQQFSISCVGSIHPQMYS